MVWSIYLWLFTNKLITSFQTVQAVSLDGSVSSQTTTAIF